MNSPYHTNGLYWQPRTKAELIKCIIDSGRWNDTKQSLKDKDSKVLRGILNSIRQKQFQEIMTIDKPKGMV